MVDISDSHRKRDSSGRRYMNLSSFSMKFRSRKSSRISIGNQAGASMVEFVLVAPVLLVVGLGTIQMGLIYHAKTTLNYATFEAARVGAVNHAQIDPMMGELAYRMAPVYGGKGSEGSAGGAIVRAMSDSVNPAYGKITILNPTEEMFDEWELADNVSGEMQIPNHHLRHQNADLIKAGVNIHDANLLKIKSEYGYKLQVPLVGKMITATLRTMNPGYTSYYLAGRIPLSSVATVRMQNEARRSQAVISVANQTATELATDIEAGTQATTAQVVAAGDVQYDDNTGSATCDPYGLGEVSDELQSLLAGDDGATEESGGQIAFVGACEATTNFSVLGGLEQQSPAATGLDPC